MRTSAPPPSQVANAAAPDHPQAKPGQRFGDWIWVLLIAAADLIVWLLWPERAAPVMRNTWEYFTDMVVVLIPVAVLIGLFEVWVPKHLIGRYLGRESGWKGVGLSLALGTAPAGPLYVAFPIAAELLRKGASPFNVAVFLNAWAAIKVPQLLVETKFLGPSFMLLRLALTVPSAIVTGWVIQTVIRRRHGPEADSR